MDYTVQKDFSGWLHKAKDGAYEYAKLYEDMSSLEADRAAFEAKAQEMHLKLCK